MKMSMEFKTFSTDDILVVGAAVGRVVYEYRVTRIVLDVVQRGVSFQQDCYYILEEIRKRIGRCVFSITHIDKSSSEKLLR